MADNTYPLHFEGMVEGYNSLLSNEGQISKKAPPHQHLLIEVNNEIFYYGLYQSTADWVSYVGPPNIPIYTGLAIVPGGTLDVFEPVWCDRVKAHTAETRRRDNHQKDGKPPIIRLLPQKKRMSTI